MTPVAGELRQLAGAGDRVLAAHVPALDGWRGVAIAAVLVAHFFDVPGIDAGRLGVDLFFVLSGLLMSNLLFVKRTPLLLFYKRRISRVIPTLWLYLAVVFGGAWLAGFVVPWSELLPTIFFLRSYLPADPHIYHASLPIAHLWSLNVEEHSYVLMGLMTLVPALVGRRAGWALLGLGLTAMALRILPVYLPELRVPLGGVEGGIGTRTESAAAHLMISAAYLLVRDRFASFVPAWAPACALALGVACYTDWAPWWSSVLVAPFLLAFAVNHLRESGAALIQLLATRPLRLLGVWSYSLYLWQQLFYRGVNTGVLSVIEGFVLAMVVGLLSFYLWEQPIRERLNAGWARGGS